MVHFPLLWPKIQLFTSYLPTFYKIIYLLNRIQTGYSAFHCAQLAAICTKYQLPTHRGDLQFWIGSEPQLPRYGQGKIPYRYIYLGSSGSSENLTITVLQHHAKIWNRRLTLQFSANLILIGPWVEQVFQGKHLQVLRQSKSSKNHFTVSRVLHWTLTLHPNNVKICIGIPSHSIRTKKQ